MSHIRFKFLHKIIISFIYFFILYFAREIFSDDQIYVFETDNETVDKIQNKVQSIHSHLECSQFFYPAVNLIKISTCDRV